MGQNHPHGNEACSGAHSSRTICLFNLSESLYSLVNATSNFSYIFKLSCQVFRQRKNTDPRPPSLIPPIVIEHACEYARNYNQRSLWKGLAFCNKPRRKTFRELYIISCQILLLVQIQSTSTRLPVTSNFYRAMHYSAKRGLAIICRLSVVCPYVRLRR